MRTVLQWITKDPVTLREKAAIDPLHQKGGYARWPPWVCWPCFVPLALEFNEVVKAARSL